MPENKKPNLVAVYGSLKKGFGNHRLLSDSKVLGAGFTDKLYTMYSCGGYPCITHKPTNQVFVEVYEVTDEVFRNLDYLEGNPTFYCREQIKVNLFRHGLKSEGLEGCWIYFIADEDRWDDKRPVYHVEPNGRYFNWENPRG